ncbi:MAG: hypothetical protein ACYC5O_24110 [Anaerolineae bacterium]
MKMLTGVLAGLIVGAALVFATLAVLGIATRDDACAAAAPEAWALRVDVPVTMLQEQVPVAPVTVAGGEFRVGGVSATECGGVLVVGNWAHPDGPALDNVGLELALETAGETLALRPRTLWFGRLPVDLGWLPRSLWQPLLADADVQLNAAVAGGGDAGLQLCGTSSGAGSVSLYLCSEAAPTE